MGVKKYCFESLATIPQFDAPLSLRKLDGDMSALNKLISDFVDISYKIDKDIDFIMENQKEYLDNLLLTAKFCQRLFATTVLWDCDNLIEALKTARRELVLERFDELKINNVQLIKKLYYAECDENGVLLHKLPEATENPLLIDKELRTQSECLNESILIPMDILQQMHDNIEDLNFDKAKEIAENLLPFNYDIEFNEALEDLIIALDEFSLDEAEEIAYDCVEFAKEFNIKANIPRALRKRILAVDDMPDILMSIKGILSKSYDVCTVTTGTSALRFLQVNKPDLILLDIELIETDGFTLLKSIRALKDFVEVPVLFLTSHTSLEYVKKARAAGVRDFLRKPINAEELFARCDRYLG